MDWIIVAVIYSAMGITTGYMMLAFYYQTTMNNLRRDQDIVSTILGTLLWPIVLPFMIMHILTRITLAIMAWFAKWDSLNKKKKSLEERGGPA